MIFAVLDRRLIQR